jgi:hypothetical protein
MASRAIYRGAVHSHKSYAKRISTHIAYALVAYTLLLIFVVSPVLETEGTEIWPYLLLVVLVGIAIVPCRNLERRWQGAFGEHGEGLFRRDAVILWLCAIGLPILMMFAFRAIS